MIPFASGLRYDSEDRMEEHRVVSGREDFSSGKGNPAAAKSEEYQDSGRVGQEGVEGASGVRSGPKNPDSEGRNDSSRGKEVDRKRKGLTFLYNGVTLFRRKSADTFYTG